MRLPYGTFSKKGFKGSGMRLHHSEYFRYSYRDENYYYKKKFYTSAYDGNIVYEEITEKTFNKAIARGNKTERLTAIEEFEKINYYVISEILSEEHEIEVKYAREILTDILETIQDFERTSGRLSEKVKRVLFEDRVKNYVRYIIPVKKIQEVM